MRSTTPRPRQDRYLVWGRRFLRGFGCFIVAVTIYLVGFCTYLLLTGRMDQLAKVGPALLIYGVFGLPTGLRWVRMRPEGYPERILHN